MVNLTPQEIHIFERSSEEIFSSLFTKQEIHKDDPVMDYMACGVNFSCLA